jgi:uncharacterized membrane protein
MTLTVILSIIFIHWVADFIFQAEEWAVNKSKSLKALLKHTVMYSFIWYIVLLGFAIYGTRFNGPKIEDLGWTPWMGLFPVITFVFHTITDYFTSKIVSRKFANNEYGSSIPNLGAFTVIGFDQVLHYIQLFGTYYLLTK